jgi:hypothetical protein
MFAFLLLIGPMDCTFSPCHPTPSLLVTQVPSSVLVGYGPTSDLVPLQTLQGASVCLGTKVLLPAGDRVVSSVIRCHGPPQSGQAGRKEVFAQMNGPVTG